jgi:hypothetical protein
MINTEQAHFATTPLGSGRFYCLCCEVYCFSNYNNERGCDADPSPQTARGWCDVLRIRNIREPTTAAKRRREQDWFVSGNSSLRETS